MSSDDADAAKPTWERLFADQIIDCTVLIGLTFCDPDGKPDRQDQFHGVVVEADETNGFLVKLQGAREGQTYRLPPHPAALRRAAPGVYRLRATGEEVADPDYLTSWTIERPAES